MNNYFNDKISDVIHSDHSFMTLAACRVLSDKERAIIDDNTGLLIRWFCELPDFCWELFGTLGEWEINNHFTFNWRRNLNVSYFLDYNPVTERGERQPHNRKGAAISVPFLIRRSVSSMKTGKIREGLAFAGAAMHFIQDIATFPYQQTLHRRVLAGFPDIDISGYEPKTLFTSPDEIDNIVNLLLTDEFDATMAEAAIEIRKSMQLDDSVMRRAAQLKTDNAGAKVTADILRSVLSFYCKSENPAVNVFMDFTKIDEERLPDGYFIDRDDSTTFQGYATVEGLLRRGYDKRETDGLQLRLSATGKPEIRWKQSLTDAIELLPTKKYEFSLSAYLDETTGCNGCRILFFDCVWNVIQSKEIVFDNTTGWYKTNETIIPPEGSIAATVDFFSRNNTGTVLIDHWLLRDEKFSKKADKKVKNTNIRLMLQPGDGFNVDDLSEFSIQNEPIISVAGAFPRKIAKDGIFIFDGEKLFIEVPFHPVYQPLQVQNILVLNLEIKPHNENGMIAMSARLVTPFAGWQFFLKDGTITVALFNSKSKWTHSFSSIPIPMNKWTNLRLAITPDGTCHVSSLQTHETAKAPFKRTYAESEHYFGSNYGISDFIHAEIKNITIEESETD